MIGSGISAVSLVSIPGNVGNNNLYYFQFILGTIVGYLFIAFVLTPIYYRLKLVSIYTYLKSVSVMLHIKQVLSFSWYPSLSELRFVCSYQLKFCNMLFLMHCISRILLQSLLF